MSKSEVVANCTYVQNPIDADPLMHMGEHLGVVPEEVGVGHVGEFLAVDVVNQGIHLRSHLVGDDVIDETGPRGAWIA